MKKKGTILIIFLTVFILIIYAYRYLNSPVLTETAKMTEVEDVVSADAYIIRNESVYHAENTGTLYTYITEGARVSKDMQIATVYQGNVDEEAVSELNNLNTKIAEVTRIIQQNENFTKDNSSNENKIESLNSQIIEAALDGDVSKIPEYKNSLNYLIDGDNGTKETELSDLIAKKKETEQKLSNDKHDIISTISGVFSENVDGYEAILTPEVIMEYKAEDFKGITKINSEQRVSNKVRAGESVCKVVDNHNWYVMTAIPKEYAKKLSEAEKLLIRFDDLPGEEVSASVSYISQEDEKEKKVVVVLKSDRYLEGVYGMRSGHMDIILSRYVGYEVPVYAIRNVKDKQGVMIKIGEQEVFRECDIVHKNDKKGTVIIYPAADAARSLNIGDKIVLGEKAKNKNEEEE